MLVHPGSGSPRKNWPADRFAALIRRLMGDRWSVSLLQGPADATAVAEVFAALGPFSREIPVARPSSVRSLAQWVARAHMLVGNDSGVAHLAARLGVPTVAIFGPTEPSQWAPRGPAVAPVGGGGNWPRLEEVLSASEALPRVFAAPVHSQGARKR